MGSDYPRRTMQFVIPVQPRPALRAKARYIPSKSGKGFVSFYDPTPNKTYKEILRAFFGEAMVGCGPFVGPIRLDIVYCLKRPKSKSASIMEHTVKPDVDNMEKILLDSMNGIVFGDDKQVVSVEHDKIYAYEEGQTFLQIREWTHTDQIQRPHVAAAIAAMELPLWLK